METIHHDHLCKDRVIPFELAEEAEQIAIAENPANAPDVAAAGGRIAVEKRKLWKKGRTLRVRFLDGDSFLHDKVKQFAAEWTRHANLNFVFGDDDAAEIRISFTFEPGSSWSAVGTDCLVEKYFPHHEPTMNFGWFKHSTPDREFSRVVVHEFGHAIGCIHEHQNPAGGIQWNEQAVIQEYSGPPNFWKEATIRFNILDKYKESQLNGTQFDPDSIMLYGFPARLTLNNFGTHDNTKLSTQDIAFIRTVYPGRP